MNLTAKKKAFIGGIIAILAVAVIVGVTVGVVVGRKKSNQETVQQRVHDILAKNPLIDG